MSAAAQVVRLTRRVRPTRRSQVGRGIPAEPGCLEARRLRRTARSQYPMSNIQYPILKSDPAESFYVLRKTGPKFLRSVENIRKVFTFYVKIAQSFYVLRKNRSPFLRSAEIPSQPVQRDLPGCSIDHWILNIGYWILNLRPSLPARGRAGSIPTLEPLI